MKPSWLVLGFLLSVVSTSSLSYASEDPKPAADARFSDWEFIKDADGVKTFRRDTDAGIVGFRGEATMNIPMEKIATLLADMESRKKWMDEVVETKRLHMKDLFDRTEYNHTAVPWPFQNRDFVYNARVELDKKTRTMIINMKSVEDPSMPPQPGIVRGKMHESRYFLREIEKGKTTFISVEIMVDPMGSIPKWIVRLKQKKWPRNTLNGLRTYLEKTEVVVPEEFKLIGKNMN